MADIFDTVADRELGNVTSAPLGGGDVFDRVADSVGFDVFDRAANYLERTGGEQKRGALGKAIDAIPRVFSKPDFKPQDDGAFIGPEKTSLVADKGGRPIREANSAVPGMGFTAPSQDQNDPRQPSSAPLSTDNGPLAIDDPSFKGGIPGFTGLVRGGMNWPGTWLKVGADAQALAGLGGAKQIMDAQMAQEGAARAGQTADMTAAGKIVDAIGEGGGRMAMEMPMLTAAGQTIKGGVMGSLLAGEGATAAGRAAMSAEEASPYIQRWLANQGLPEYVAGSIPDWIYPIIVKDVTEGAVKRSEDGSSTTAQILGPFADALRSVSTNMLMDKAFHVLPEASGVVRIPGRMAANAAVTTGQAQLDKAENGGGLLTPDEAIQAAGEGAGMAFVMGRKPGLTKQSMDTMERASIGVEAPRAIETATASREKPAYDPAKLNLTAFDGSTEGNRLSNEQISAFMSETSVGQALGKTIADLRAAGRDDLADKLQITSANAGGHTKGSKHYAGNAVDINSKAFTPDELAELDSFASANGLSRPMANEPWHLQITQPKAPETQSPYVFGSITAKNESSGKGDMISTGAGDPGGASYGRYQIPKNTGTMAEFIRWSGLEPPAHPGTPEFNKWWKEQSADPKFDKLQHDFIVDTHYTPVADYVRTQYGFDPNVTPGTAELFFAVANAHGVNGAKSVIDRAFAGEAPKDAVEAIQRIQAERSRVDDRGKLVYWTSSSNSLQKGLQNRLKRETDDFISLAGGDPVRVQADTTAKYSEHPVQRSEKYLDLESKLLAKEKSKLEQELMTQPTADRGEQIFARLDELAAKEEAIVRQRRELDEQRTAGDRAIERRKAEATADYEADPNTPKRPGDFVTDDMLTRAGQETMPAIPTDGRTRGEAIRGTALPGQEMTNSVVSRALRTRPSEELLAQAKRVSEPKTTLPSPTIIGDTPSKTPQKPVLDAFGHPVGESVAKEQKIVSEAHRDRVKGVWDKLEQIKAERAAREAEQVTKPQVDGSKTQRLHEVWRMNQALRDGKSPAELGLPVQASKEATDLRSRLDKYAHGRGTPEGAPRDSAADSALRELVSRLEAVKAPVEAKPGVTEGRVQDSEIKNAPGAAAEKAAPVEVAREPKVESPTVAPTEPAPPKSPPKSPGKSPRKLPGKSALAKEMEAMGLDFTKPEDYATYRIMKLIEGGKPLPQEKATKKAKVKSETVDKDAEARLAEDLAREESKARKRVEEEKARDEAPEVESEGEETRGDPESPHVKNPSDSKGKSKSEGKSEEILTPKKPTPKPKKSTPSTPEQAAKEALWKFQAAHAEVKDGEAETSFAQKKALREEFVKKLKEWKPGATEKDIRDFQRKNSIDPNQAKKLVRASIDDIFEQPSTTEAESTDVRSKPVTEGKKEPEAKPDTKSQERPAGLKKAAVEDAIKDIQSSAKNAIDTEVVQSQSLLPAHVRDSLGDKRVSGVWDEKNSKVWLIADNLTSPQHAVAKWMHEQVVHNGLRGLFKDAKAFDSFLDKATAIIRRSDLERIAKKYGIDLRTAGGMREAAEEYLAHIGEQLDRGQDLRGEKRTIWRKLKGFINDKFGARWMDDKHLAQIVKDAGRWTIDGDRGNLVDKIDKMYALATHNDNNVFRKYLRDGVLEHELAREMREPWYKSQVANIVREMKYPERTVESLPKSLRAGFHKSPLASMSEDELGKAFRASIEGMSEDTVESYTRAVVRSRAVDDKTVGTLRRTFMQPQWFAKRHEGFKNIFRVQLDRTQEASSRRFKAFAEVHSAYDRLSDKQLKNLSGLIWAVEGRKFAGIEDAIVNDGKDAKGFDVLKPNERHYEQVEELLYNSADKFKDHGIILDKGVIDAFVATRRMLDKILIDGWNHLRQNGDVSADHIMKFRSELGRIHNYFPHKRYGDHYLRVWDEDGKTVYYTQFDGGIGPKSAKKYVRDGRAAKIIDSIKGEYGDHLKSKRYEYGRVQELPQMLFDTPMMANLYNQITKQAVKRMKLDDAATKELTQILHQNIADVIKKRGWGQHQIRRLTTTGIAGYERDNLYKVLYDYTSGFYGWMSKVDAVKRFGDELRKMDGVKDSDEYQYSLRYVKDMLRNSDAIDRAVSKAKNAMFLYFLGGNIKSAAVNLTQNIISGVPRLSMETGMINASRYFKSAMDTVTKNLDQTEIRLLEEAHGEGVTESQLLRDMQGKANGDGLTGKATSKLTRLLGLPMSVAEGFNRQSLLLAAFRAARDGKITNQKTLDKLGIKKGEKVDVSTDYGYDLAKEFAEEIVNDAHFIMGKSNLPQFLRGSDMSKMASTAYTFRSFTHGMLSLWRWMLSKETGWEGKKALAASLGSLWAIGGLTALPFFKTALTAVRQLLGYDAEDDIDGVTQRFFEDGPGARDLLMYGLPSKAGISLGGSLAINSFGSDDLKATGGISGLAQSVMSDVIGVPAGLGEQFARAAGFGFSGDWYRAAESAAPATIRQVMSAKRLHEDGITSASGAPVMGDDGEPAKLTEKEAALKAVGFQPIRATKSYDLQKRLEDRQQSRSLKAQAFANRLARARRAEDEDAIDNVLSDLADYNERMYDSDKPDMAIKYKDVRARLQAKKAKKSQRAVRSSMIESMGLDDEDDDD